MAVSRAFWPRAAVPLRSNFYISHCEANSERLEDVESSCAMNKVSKGSKGSPDPNPRKVERQDGTAGSLRGADASLCVDHRLRVGHQDHGGQCVNDHQYDNPDNHGYFGD